jgi:hypothetical protein
MSFPNDDPAVGVGEVAAGTCGSHRLSVLRSVTAGGPRRPQLCARLEEAALTTARALQEISGHWNEVV